MSAFMMSNETLSMLAELIYRYSISRGDSFEMWFPAELFVELGDKVYYRELIFKELAELNIKSLKERYGDNADDMFDEVDFVHGCDIWESTPYGGVVRPWYYQVLKSLDCYLYQSCEGQCYELPLYKAIEKWRDKWGCYIAQHLPAYDEADWK